MHLIAGPWVGEFGWELMSWQGFVRAKANEEKFESVTVAGPPGHEALYADFCDTYLPVTLNGIKDCWRVEQASPRERGALAHQLDRLVNGNTRTLCPGRLIPTIDQHFIRFGNQLDAETEDLFDVLIHVRHPINKRKSHAWHPVHAETVCEKLRERGFSTAAIGTEAACPMNATDRRNIPLKRLMNMMAVCGAVIGPSSGPMHLASLCHTPHVVWTDKQWYSAIRGTNRRRYEQVWNPLNTPCTILEEGWQPSPDLIALKTEEALRGT